MSRIFRMTMETRSDVPQAERLPWRRLGGKVVMITGTSSGVGREICLDLAAAGCFVVAAARRLDCLRSLCDEINQMTSSRAGYVDLDLSSSGERIDLSVKKAWDLFGRVEVLVNNGGIRGQLRSPLELPEEEWNSMLSTNLRGTWLVTKSVCRRMQRAGIKGSVINVSSIDGAGRGQSPGALHYAVTKMGIQCMTRVMAMELGPMNIRVNTLSPGLFESEITAGLMTKKWMAKVIGKTVPLKDTGRVHRALTSVVRYLIHDASAYARGATLLSTQESPSRASPSSRLCDSTLILM